jgi:hypothetical protein
MTPDRYEVSPRGRGRMTGQLKKRSRRLGLPTWGGFLLGAVFAATGAWVILVGTKVVAVNPATVHAPYWVLTVAGAAFAAGGLWLWSMTGVQAAANRRRTVAARRHPNEPALADYPWHPDGFTVSEWTRLVQSLAVALGLTVFLSMFNWWACQPDAPRMIRGIVGLFDLIALSMWVMAALQLGRALKYGHSRVEYLAFPYHPPNPVVLRWRPVRGVSRVKSGTFTLRCVSEWMESSGPRHDRNNVLVHEEIWNAQWILTRPRNFQPTDPMDLRYELPPDAIATSLSADKPFFWELEVKLDVPGLKFNETYLVPVYGKG